MAVETLERSAVDVFSDRVLQIIDDASLALMIGIGHRTELFDRMAALPPASDEIARAASLSERYVREWLGFMVTGGIVTYGRGDPPVCAAGRARRLADACGEPDQYGRDGAGHRRPQAGGRPPGAPAGAVPVHYFLSALDVRVAGGRWPGAGCDVWARAGARDARRGEGSPTSPWRRCRTIPSTTPTSRWPGDRMLRNVSGQPSSAAW